MGFLPISYSVRYVVAAASAPHYALEQLIFRILRNKILGPLVRTTLFTRD